MRHFLAAASFFALAACGLQGQDNEKSDEAGATTKATPSDANLIEMASHDDGTDLGPPDSEARPVMQAQVILDRLGFTPGVVDGKEGMSTANALKGFQEANGLTVTGEMDEATKAKLAAWQKIPATRVVTIPADWDTGPYYATPEDAADQAKMDKLGYTSLDERLAERFHTTVDTLKLLNPGGVPAGMQGAVSTGASSAAAAPSPSPTPTPSASGDAFTPTPGPASTFRAGQQIRVPNVGADRLANGAVDDAKWQQTLVALGVGSEQPDVAKIVVSKKGGTLKAYDAADKLVALFTVTTGSTHDPLPLGKWKINGIAKNPPFAYDPNLFWDVADSEQKQQLPPGPNGPVGVVWIDLSKEHYGIHGTPEPQTIGRAQSHGCVRLTNWDAARLAQMVSSKTQVLFEA